MKLSWQYVAGFFDGEGTLGCSGMRGAKKPNGAFFARMYQSDDTVLFAIKEFLASHGVESTIVRPKRVALGNAPVVALNIRTSQIPAFLDHLRPYAVVKKQIVEDVWRYRKLYPALTPSQMARVAGEARWAA